ncbi:MAG: methylamine utilization protein [Gammaproteobacteria bacterium]|nr:methylamine utilization protein [Gammaproteobacteria bacterium]
MSGTFAVMWFCLGTSHQANAGELRISIQDADTGTPLEDVIVEVILPAESQPTYLTTVDASVDQQEKEFVANVTVITRGSRANFPNSDDILHHVYSFSPAKVFELPLYGNGQNIDYYQLFDLPGVIELGCNIHDWMLGYIYVSQTDLVAKTDRTGQAVISNIPAGEYEVRIWHSRADTGAPEMNQQVVFSDTQPARLQMALTLQRDSRLRRAPDATRTRYR